jgi:outer membrane protein OmpA-like peptidoglycan-associated protein
MQARVKSILLSTLVSILLCYANNSSADTNGTTNLGKRIASKSEIINLLTPAQTQAMAPNGGLPTRGLHLWQKPATETAAEPQPSEKKAISLEVRFGFDSAELTDEAKTQLTPVAQALTSNELNSLNFVLEGHTDAAGSDTYNLSLSEKRAQSVKNFFIDEYGVEPSRLNSVGKGESELLDNGHPDDDANRRVTIITQ